MTAKTSQPVRGYQDDCSLSPPDLGHNPGESKKSVGRHIGVLETPREEGILEIVCLLDGVLDDADLSTGRVLDLVSSCADGTFTDCSRRCNLDLTSCDLHSRK